MKKNQNSEVVNSQNQNVCFKLFVYLVIIPVSALLMFNPIAFTIWTLVNPKVTVRWIREGYWKEYPGVGTIAKCFVSWVPRFRLYPWSVRKFFVKDNPNRYSDVDVIRAYYELLQNVSKKLATIFYLDNKNRFSEEGLKKFNKKFPGKILHISC